MPRELMRRSITNWACKEDIAVLILYSHLPRENTHFALVFNLRRAANMSWKATLLIIGVRFARDLAKKKGRAEVMRLPATSFRHLSKWTFHLDICIKLKHNESRGNNSSPIMYMQSHGMSKSHACPSSPRYTTQFSYGCQSKIRTPDT